MTNLPDDWYEIDKIMRDNYLALFKEIKANASKGPASLYAWFEEDGQEVIDQSIHELETLESCRMVF